jgi:hypothetical protein
MFLEQLLEIQVDLSTVDAMEKKTEGWVTGLRLTALSMRHRSNLDPHCLSRRWTPNMSWTIFSARFSPTNRRKSANIFWPPLSWIAFATRCARQCACRKRNRIPAKSVVGSLSIG